MLITICSAFVANTYANEKQTYIVDLKSLCLMQATENAFQREHFTVLSKSELEKYQSLGMVESFEPNYEVKLFSDNWNLDAINCDFSWELGCFGNGVNIGIIDSGLYEFDEIKDNIVKGYNYLDDSENTIDNKGHGTFIAGIIASESRGISYKSKIVPLKCFDVNTKTYVADILNAIYDAVEVYDCDVINMSFGFNGISEKLDRAIKYAVNNGVIVVASVGNDGTNTLYYPAAYENVIGVGSVNEQLITSSFSQHNQSVMVTAPGENLKSLSIDGFTGNSGTSFSAPHIAALAAIAKSINKNIDTDKFSSILANTSTDKGANGYDEYFGYGIVNFESFINKLIENETIFISPIIIAGKNISATLYNNSSNTVNAYLIYASYENGNFKQMKSVPISVGSKCTSEINEASDDDTIKFMAWKNLSGLAPLAKARMINN